MVKNRHLTGKIISSFSNVQIVNQCKNIVEKSSEKEENFLALKTVLYEVVVLGIVLKVGRDLIGK